MRRQFQVWAPYRDRVDVHVVSPFDKTVPMEKGDDGFFVCEVDGVDPGARYFFRLDGERERPDPASRFQPEGVHGPSEVVDLEPQPRLGRPFREYVIYEAHIGTLTPRGTFESAIEVLDELVDLGITAFEIMPIAQFPGERNWGYDGVYPYAPQNSYGGPDGLRTLVRACHDRGLAVVLDCVYNHFGPEGCYLDDFGPYFTDNYETPWGRAIDFTKGPVREFFIGNAIQWFDDFGIDALRLDAVDQIHDPSPKHFLQELAERTSGFLIAEHETPDPRLVSVGLDAVWNDDFHHSLIAHITGQRDGYFANYGSLDQFAQALDGPLPSGRAVVFSANHDQIGNRALGDRPATRLDPEQLKLVAAAVLLSPSIPLIFMGEEYGETQPFQYFTSHGDQRLVERVRRGRRAEFASFNWDGDIPDPQDPATFERSKLDRSRADEALRAFYKELIALRARFGVGDRPEVTVRGDTLVVKREAGTITLHFGPRPSVEVT